MSRRERFEARVLRGMMALPPRVQRVLAGRPVVLDGNQLAPDIQMMLRLQIWLREPAVGTLPVEHGRQALRRASALVGGDQPVTDSRDLMVGDLPARLYIPRERVADRPGPLLVFFHGGGFIYGADHSTHEQPLRFLAEHAGVRILSVDYRLAPEDPFPAAVDDAIASYSWAVENAESLGADLNRIGVGGDSAGANLAAVVAIDAARRGLPLALQLLLYPVVDMQRRSRSRDLFGEGFFLDNAFMDLAMENYLTPEQAGDERASVITAELPEGLAPAIVVTAGFDPLRDEGEEYAELLRAAGTDVWMRRYPGLIHGFFNMVAAGRTAPAANLEIADRVRGALAAG